ncbi:hypothetical protein IU436_29370 [Nocardia farcinica]|uniref:hypothetical protein n=1 Tax=Nocardia farcinica TaxID=37329 RepID=UPI001895B508|nr:hypothetical protein [Nocardia farcinica]MBF6422716.1 hypothetical protein [Nocardia farcinica]MBF6434434.1 hypothetical protein [Nocardia farcinica]MBF6505519.1 hypothetical protein [Nocardia farcinica]
MWATTSGLECGAAKLAAWTRSPDATCSPANPLRDAIQLPWLADLVNAPTEGKKSTYTITGITSIPR